MTTTSPIVELSYLRSERTEPKCICCPDEPSHVYGYNAKVGEEHFDPNAFVWRALRDLPDGTKFRIVVEPVPVKICRDCGADIEHESTAIGWVDIRTDGTYDQCPMNALNEHHPQREMTKAKD